VANNFEVGVIFGSADVHLVTIRKELVQLR
jgi:hypothetical protein